jgi:hypothetical protein
MGRYAKDIQLSLLDRLLNKVVVDSVTDCWNFTGGKNNIGYGMIRDGKGMRTTHRVSYEEHNGKIPQGMLVLHSCDNTLCVAPHHLRLGTHKDNTHDMISKGRARPFGGLPGGTGGMKGKIMPRTTCVHCNRSISNPAYSRSHGNNCRQKQIV